MSERTLRNLQGVREWTVPLFVSEKGREEYEEWISRKPLEALVLDNRNILSPIHRYEVCSRYEEQHGLDLRALAITQSFLKIHLTNDEVSRDALRKEVVDWLSSRKELEKQKLEALSKQ
jgi:hypothetical protein